MRVGALLHGSTRLDPQARVRLVHASMLAAAVPPLDAATRLRSIASRPSHSVSVMAWRPSRLDGMKYASIEPLERPRRGRSQVGHASDRLGRAASPTTLVLARSHVRTSTLPCWSWQGTLALVEAVTGVPCCPMDLELLERRVAERGEPAYRTRQVWEWAARGAPGYDDMTNVPAALREALDADVPFSTLTVADASSGRGTAP